MLCGLGRLSARSFVAVAIFFPVAALTHRLGLSAPQAYQIAPTGPPAAIETLALVAAAESAALLVLPRLASSARRASELTAALSGVAFASGLIMTGMASPAKVLQFFDVGRMTFDPSLAVLAIVAVVPQMIFVGARGLEGTKPRYAEAYGIAKGQPTVSARLVIGSILFGRASRRSLAALTPCSGMGRDGDVPRAGDRAGGRAACWLRATLARLVCHRLAARGVVLNV